MVLVCTVHATIDCSRSASLCSYPSKPPTQHGVDGVRTDVRDCCHGVARIFGQRTRVLTRRRGIWSSVRRPFLRTANSIPVVRKRDYGRLFRAFRFPEAASRLRPKRNSRPGSGGSNGGGVVDCPLWRASSWPGCSRRGLGCEPFARRDAQITPGIVPL